jgi:hypothetical protein
MALQNDGQILYEDPDIEARGKIPPRENLIITLPRKDQDATLYDWIINDRDEDGVYYPSDPGAYTFEVAQNVVKVIKTVKVHKETPILVQGYLFGRHKLLKAEISGLTTIIVFYRDPGDPTNLTTFDWTLHRWHDDTREYVREPATNYTTVREADKVTITLVNSVTTWVSTRLLGVLPPEPQPSDSGIFTALCYSSDAVGDAVYIMGDRVNGSFQVTKVDIDESNVVKAVACGVIIQKLSPTTCKVQTSGRILGLYTGLTPGLSLFVQEDSRLGHAPPVNPPVGRRVVQSLAYALAADVLLVRPWPPTRVLPSLG